MDSSGADTCSSRVPGCGDGDIAARARATLDHLISRARPRWLSGRRLLQV